MNVIPWKRKRLFPKILETCVQKWRLLILVPPIMVLSGCSLVGFGIGAIIDQSADEEITVYQIAGLEEGDDLRIEAWTGSSVEGSLVETVRLDSQRYTVRYGEYAKRLSSSLDLPLVGDVITIVGRDEGSELTGILIGFDPGVIMVRWTPTVPEMPVRIRSFERINGAEGTSISTDTLITLMSTGRVPYLTAIRLETETGNTLVYVEEIASIRRDNFTGNRWIGFGIGATADAAIITSGVFKSSGKPEAAAPARPCEPCMYCIGLGGGCR